MSNLPVSEASTSPTNIGASTASSTSNQKNVPGTTLNVTTSTIMPQIPMMSYMPRFTMPMYCRDKIDRTELHLPSGSAMQSVSADIPLPCNWSEQMDYVSHSLETYKLFPVDSMSVEFKTLAELMQPLQIIDIERIVNPSIWNRFENERKEMLKAKSNDSTLLKHLGMSDDEIAKRQQSLNFLRHNSLDAAPYSDNFGLLFHCTNDPRNIKYILRDGFDERVNNGGRLGGGIYFADNVTLSAFYDGCSGVLFICGVLLGDCMLSTECSEFVYSKREPEKLPAERRHIDDNFFDSVSGGKQRGNAYVTDQYVVYNRYKCCPLYKVSYKRPVAMTEIDPIVMSPPFVWASERIHNQLIGDPDWPLYAKTVFDEINGRIRFTPFSIQPIRVTRNMLDEKLKTLKDLGYTDEQLNLKILKENSFEMNPTLRALMKCIIDEQSQSDTESEGSSYHTSTDEDNPKERPSTRQLQKKTIDCPICCSEYKKNSRKWKILSKCDHKLCVDCYMKIEVTRTTMTGTEHTFMKCPFCNSVDTGIEIGNCPNGYMAVKYIKKPCAGYEDCNTIKIIYSVSMLPLTLGATLQRAAYLPNNAAGQKVLSLLRTAWDRRLIFTVGTSHTTGSENAVVWNIHHKTRLNGGVSCHGYPDATYLDRVTAELKGFGIE